MVSSIHYPPADSHLLQNLMNISSCLTHRGLRGQISVMPYMGYAGQDTKYLDGEFVTISLIARLLECTGIRNLITVDIHSIRALSVFKSNLINISSINSLADFTGAPNLVWQILSLSLQIPVALHQLMNFPKY